MGKLRPEAGLKKIRRAANFVFDMRNTVCSMGPTDTIAPRAQEIADDR